MDAARGVAILMMVLYHLVYDLYAFGDYPLEATSGFWALFADATASLFLLLVGVSLAISHRRARQKGEDGFRKYLLRGLRILGYGMLLTAVFWVFDLGVVAFGILHLIGVSVILAYPLLSYRLANVVLGAAVFAAGVWMISAGVSSESPWLLPLGVAPEGLSMPDYRPVLPWFGMVLFGLAAGNAVYGAGRRPAGLGDKEPALARVLSPLGRRSLAIYLVHQPVLILLLSVLGIVDVGLF